MPRSYSPEFRRRVLDRLDAGHTVAGVAAYLGVSDQTIYNWRTQHQIDTGQRDGLSSSDHVELVAARKRIAQLEAELSTARRAVDLLKADASPKAGARRLNDGRRAALDQARLPGPGPVGVDVLRDPEQAAVERV